MDKNTLFARIFLSLFIKPEVQKEAKRNSTENHWFKHNPAEFDKISKFRKTEAVVKLHLRLVYSDMVYPEKITTIPAEVHDHKQFEVLIDDREVMYVFDRFFD